MHQVTEFSFMAFAIFKNSLSQEANPEPKVYSFTFSWHLAGALSKAHYITVDSLHN